MVDLSGHSTWAKADLYEILQDLVEALFLLQAMSKSHEERIATIESTVLKTSEDRESDLPVQLQFIESLIAPLSESEVRQTLGVADRPFAVDSCKKLDLAVERAALELRCQSLNELIHWRKCFKRLEHFATPNALKQRMVDTLSVVNVQVHALSRSPEK